MKLFIICGVLFIHGQFVETKALKRRKIPDVSEVTSSYLPIIEENPSTQPMKEVDELITEEPTTVEPTTEPTTTTDDPLESYRNLAVKVIMEKLLSALGPDFPKGTRAGSEIAMPTVFTPLNIVADPCPDRYAQCSSEIFHPSCENPPKSNPLLWKTKFNLYFDLPHDLLKTDELLNATLKLYKTSKLPLNEPIQLTVELHRYLRSFTRDKDIHIKINSTTVMSDFLGWISIDVTDLIRHLKPKKNHGFLIKVQDERGILWSVDLFVPMDCSSNGKNVVPLPFGIRTDLPEQRFPALLITTGSVGRYYDEPLAAKLERETEEKLEEYIIHKENELSTSDISNSSISKRQIFQKSDKRSQRHPSQSFYQNPLTNEIEIPFRENRMNTISPVEYTTERFFETERNRNQARSKKHNSNSKRNIKSIEEKKIIESPISSVEIVIRSNKLDETVVTQSNESQKESKKRKRHRHNHKKFSRKSNSKHKKQTKQLLNFKS